MGRLGALKLFGPFVLLTFMSLVRGLWAHPKETFVGTAVVIKTHHATSAMVDRWCHALNVELNATAHPMALFLLNYDAGFPPPQNSLPKADLTPAKCDQRVIKFDWLAVAMALGRELDFWEAFHFDFAVDVGAVAASPALRSFEHIWILEQDVAWQGNLFDALGVADGWDADFVTPGGHSEYDRAVPLARPMNLGLAASASPWGTTRFASSYKQAARYSQRFIRDLGFELHGFTPEALSAQDVANSETWPATMCAGQLGRLSRMDNAAAKNCTMRGLSEASPPVWGYLVASCNSPCLWTADNWRYDAAASPPQLFHPAKW